MRNKDINQLVAIILGPIASFFITGSLFAIAMNIVVFLSGVQSDVSGMILFLSCVVGVVFGLITMLAILGD